MDSYTLGSLYDDSVDLSLITDKWDFIRGYFDNKGTLHDIQSKDEPECNLEIESTKLYEYLVNNIDIPWWITDNNLNMTFTGTNCIDFLGKLYENSVFRDENNYEKYVDWLLWSGYDLPECQVYKTDVNAVIPSKSKESDAGYDLTVIKVAKQFLQNITLYDTGIKIKVSHGLYAEVVPRSSLSKSGYMLANSIGIIDRAYTGNILIALIKVDPTAPDIELPFKCCQLIFRKQVHVNINEVNKPFDETSRGTGGFGSTGK